MAKRGRPRKYQPYLIRVAAYVEKNHDGNYLAFSKAIGYSAQPVYDFVYGFREPTLRFVDSVIRNTGMSYEEVLAHE